MHLTKIKGCCFLVYRHISRCTITRMETSIDEFTVNSYTCSHLIVVVFTCSLTYHFRHNILQCTNNNCTALHVVLQMIRTLKYRRAYTNILPLFPFFSLDVFPFVSLKLPTRHYNEYPYLRYRCYQTLAYFV